MSDHAPIRGRRGHYWVIAALLAVSGVAGLLVATGAWDALGAQVRAARWEPQQPTGPDRLTERMRTVRDAVTKEFDVPAGSGCFREEGGVPGGGEHPLGRACDFMLGPAGKRAEGDADRLGKQIVAWAQENADEYGIWYVIYEQRIWSSRFPQRGNDLMEDRGSITLNHFDHVHISVY